MGKKDYNKRSDVEKIESQWTKLSGLHTRSEWSAAVVRAATAAELAANLAIRQEFAARSKFDPVFVDGLLHWANGLSGKLDKLLLPLLKGQDKHEVISKLCSLARKVNDKRNDIAHRGVFCSEKEATAQIANCKKFVVGLVRHYVADLICMKRPAGERKRVRGLGYRHRRHRCGDRKRVEPSAAIPREA